MLRRPTRSDLPHLAVASLVLLSTAVFGGYGLARHSGMLTNAWDMGQMIQVLWNIRHGHAFSTVTGMSPLGDHARFILFPLAFLGLPARGLILGQAFALALGAVPLYLLVRRAAGPWSGVAVAALWVNFPALQWTALFDVHPEVLAAPLLLWAFWAVETRRWWTYGILVTLALACREDVSVAVALLGLILVAERRWRPGVATLGAAAVGFTVSTLVQRAANPAGLSVLRQRYGYLGDGLGDILKNVFLHPTTTFAGQGLRLSAVLMVLSLLLPAVPLVFARWPRLLAAAPLPLLNLFSVSAPQRSIYFHYGYLAAVFIFIAAADGIVRIRGWRPVVRRVAALGSAVTVVTATLFVSPFTELGYHGSQPGVLPRPASIQRQLAVTMAPGWDAQARAALALVGPGSVSSSATVLPQLAERHEAYMFPNPFYQKWYGRLLAVDPGPEQRAHMPDNPPDWIIMDKLHAGPDTPEIHDEILSLLPARYRLVSSTEFFDVWEIKK